MDRIDPAQVRDRWWALVNVVMKLRVPSISHNQRPISITIDAI